MNRLHFKHVAAAAVLLAAAGILLLSNRSRESGGNPCAVCGI